jgi:hypothetical protein
MMRVARAEPVLLSERCVTSLHFQTRKQGIPDTEVDIGTLIDAEEIVQRFFGQYTLYPVLHIKDQGIPI